MSEPFAYLSAEPRAEVEYLSTDEVTTAVVKATDYPMAELRDLFDAAFSGIFPALAERGIEPAGAAYSLYWRMPSETVDIEVGVPIASPLGEKIALGNGYELEQSSLPATRVAAMSYHGAYDSLGEAWGDLLTTVSTGGLKPMLPYWEVYVTEPKPDMDPATLRTDLYTVVDEPEGP